MRSVCVGILAFTLGCASRPEPEPVWVGHVVPLSGADQARGDHAKLGVRLAMDKAQADGLRVAGRRIAVDHADTHSDPATVRGVVKRLLTVNRVAALLGGREVAQMDSLGTQADAGGVPFVLSGGVPLQPAQEFVFFTGMTPAPQGKVLARFAGQELKAGKVAVLSDGKHGPLVEAFAREFPKNGVVGTRTYDKADQLKAAVEELRSHKPEALLFAGPAADVAELGRAGLDEKLPVLFGGDEESAAALHAQSPAPAVYLATAFAPDDATPAVKEFVAAYQKRFDDAPDVFAALAYDSARLLFEALRQAGSADPAKVRDALNGLRLEGVTGPLVVDKDDTVSRTLYVVRLREGRAETRKRYGPSEMAAKGGP